jgi:hypothetical protein
MTDYDANLIWELIYFTPPTQEGTKVHFWALGRPREFQIMFDSDGHMVLDILPIRSNYNGRGASKKSNHKHLVLTDRERLVRRRAGLEPPDGYP